MALEAGVHFRKGPSEIVFPVMPIRTADDSPGAGVAWGWPQSPAVLSSGGQGAVARGMGKGAHREPSATDGPSPALAQVLAGFCLLGQEQGRQEQGLVAGHFC